MLGDVERDEQARVERQVAVAVKALIEVVETRVGFHSNCISRAENERQPMQTLCE